MVVTIYGISFGACTFDNRWFWCVWGNMPLEFSTPPIFFGFVSTFSDVQKQASIYGLQASRSLSLGRHGKDNEYTKYYLEHNSRSNCVFRCYKREKNAYTVGIWETFTAFLDEKEPVAYENKIEKDVLDELLQKHHFNQGSTIYSNSNHLALFLQIQKAQKEYEKGVRSEILGFMYTPPRHEAYADEREWTAHAILKETDKSIYVDRLPYCEARVSQQDWRSIITYPAVLSKDALQKSGHIYVKSFEGEFFTAEKMQKEIQKSKKTNKRYLKEIQGWEGERIDTMSSYELEQYIAFCEGQIGDGNAYYYYILGQIYNLPNRKVANKHLATYYFEKGVRAGDLRPILPLVTLAHETDKVKAIAYLIVAAELDDFLCDTRDTLRDRLTEDEMLDAQTQAQEISKRIKPKCVVLGTLGMPVK